MIVGMKKREEGKEWLLM